MQRGLLQPYYLLSEGGLHVVASYQSRKEDLMKTVRTNSMQDRGVT